MTVKLSKFAHSLYSQLKELVCYSDDEYHGTFSCKKQQCSQSALAERIGADEGYLSRTLKQLRQAGLIDVVVIDGKRYNRVTNLPRGLVRDGDKTLARSTLTRKYVCQWCGKEGYAMRSDKKWCSSACRMRAKRSK